MPGLKLLIVDDDVLFVDRVVTQLKQEPIVVSWVVNSSNVFTRIESLSPDVVILNTSIADMNAMAMLTRIKTAYPLIEVIMLAEQRSVKTAIAGMQQGALDYLKKPVNANDLIRKVKTAYDKRIQRQKKIDRFKKILT